MSRLSIEIDAEQHRKIKTLATFEGKTIKDFILSRTLKSSSEKDATEHLLASQANADRLRDAIAEPQGSGVTFDSIEELEHALGV